MATNSFDIVVLGGELSGLIAATLTAERGYRVALVRGETAPTSYQLGDFSLPIEPFALLGLDAPVIQRAVEQLQFTHALRRKVRHPTPAFQLVTPEARLDVVGDDDELARELARELGTSSMSSLAPEVAEIARGLDPLLAAEGGLGGGGFRQRREHGRLMAELAEDATALLSRDQPPLIKALLTAPAAASCPLAGDQLADVARLRTFDHWRRGTPRIAGDLAGLCDLLLERFQSHGGEVLDERPTELTYGWGGKVTGVSTRSGDKLGANQVIAAMSVNELAVLLGEKGLKKIGETVGMFEAIAYRYTLNLVVDEAGIPEGMGPTVLCIRDLDAPLVGDNFLRVHVDEPDDRARVVVTVSAICPIPSSDRTVEDELGDLRVGVRESLEVLMPFFSQHVILAHSPHELAPAEGRDHDGKALGRAFAPRPIWRISGDAGGADGIGALPHQIGFKNLTMASPQVLPGLGLEGEFAAGLSAAKLAAQGAGKRKPPREVLASR